MMIDIKHIRTSIFTMAAALVLALPIYAGSAKGSKKKKAAPTMEKSISTNDSQRFAYFFLEAEKQKLMGNYTAAFDLLNHCIEINPNAPESYFMRSDFYLALKKDSLAGLDLARAAALNPNEDLYTERLARYHISEGKYEEAIKDYEKLYDHNYNRADMLDILLRLYNQTDNYRAMIKTLNRMELIEGASEQISIQKMQVYEARGDKKAAYNELKSLVDKHPNETQYKVMTSNWLLNNNRPEEALKMLNDILKEDPDNTPAEMSLLDYYKAVNKTSEYNTLLIKLLVSPKTPDDSKTTMMRQLVMDNEKEGGDSTKLLTLFNKVLAIPQKSSTMWQLYAAYLTLKKMPQDSINKALNTILSIEPDNAGARLQLLQAQWAAKNYDKVIELCKPALQYNPDELAFYYFQAIAYSQEDKVDDALHSLKQGVSQIKKDSDPAIVSDFYGLMGDIMHEKGDTAEAFAAYDSCLQWKPDNYPCLNNYAYYLSETGQQLQRAEQMSYKTVKAEPNNATYLDTYAWILFLEKRYEEAQVYIDQAIANDSTPGAVIFEHAGDIHALNGNNDKALDFWQKASAAGSKSKALPRKIKHKKYFAK